eukprot:c18299_g1_i1.p1 GENE.c18299_g1_i1~~c18299_g1_i1.p1  ORF type:complete len:767 (-),score=184.77 c18299_g1_i1:601-2766(-)
MRNGTTRIMPKPILKHLRRHYHERFTKKDRKRLKELLKQEIQPPARIVRSFVVRSLQEHLPLDVVERLEHQNARTRWVVVMLLAFSGDEVVLQHTLNYLANALGMTNDSISCESMWDALRASSAVLDYHPDTGYHPNIGMSRALKFALSAMHGAPVPVRVALPILLEILVCRLARVVELDTSVYNHLTNMLTQDFIEHDKKKRGLITGEQLKKIFVESDFGILDEVKIAIIEKSALITNPNEEIEYIQTVPILVDGILFARAKLKLIEDKIARDEQEMFWRRREVVKYLCRLASLPQHLARELAEVNNGKLSSSKFHDVMTSLGETASMTLTAEEISNMWNALETAAQSGAVYPLHFSHLVVMHLYTIALHRIRTMFASSGCAVSPPQKPKRAHIRTIVNSLPEKDFPVLSDFLVMTGPYDSSSHEHKHVMHLEYLLFDQYHEKRVDPVVSDLEPLRLSAQGLAHSLQFDVRQLCQLMGQNSPEYRSLLSDPLHRTVNVADSYQQSSEDEDEDEDQNLNLSHAANAKPDTRSHATGFGPVGKGSSDEIIDDIHIDFAAPPLPEMIDVFQSGTAVRGSRQHQHLVLATTSRDDDDDGEEGVIWQNVRIGNEDAVREYLNVPVLSHESAQYPLSVPRHLVDPRLTLTNTMERSLLHVAVIHPDAIQVVETLLRSGIAQWTTPDVNNETPMHLACWFSNAKAVDLLLKRADPLNIDSLWVSGRK